MTEEQVFPDLSPCQICGKPAKTIWGEPKGEYPIMFGMHRICAQQIRIEEPEKEGDN